MQIKTTSEADRNKSLRPVSLARRRLTACPNEPHFAIARGDAHAVKRFSGRVYQRQFSKRWPLQLVYVSNWAKLDGPKRGIQDWGFGL